MESFFIYRDGEVDTMITDFVHLLLLSSEEYSFGKDECVTGMFKVLKRTNLSGLPKELAG
jgi:hypothetical protein